MKTARHPKTRKFWVIPSPGDPPDTEPMGPYDRKADAEEDRKGVANYLAEDAKRKPGWVSTDKRKFPMSKAQVESMERAKAKAKAMAKATVKCL